MNKIDVFKALKAVAIIGNGLYILWIFYNGMDEGFKAPPVQFAAYVGIMGLLLLNIVLLVRKPR